MPAVNKEADQLPVDAPLGRAVALLVDALQILDDYDFSPEIGARLQEVIETLSAQEFQT